MKLNPKAPLLILVGLLCLFTITAHADDKKPNVIFILADDMGTFDVGAYGQKLIKTPNIDRLAKEGIRFTQHYAGSAVCAPSRDVLMTGMHTGHSTIRGNYPFETEGNLPIPDKSVTVAEIFKSKGYTTGMMGKWGLGGPGSTGGPTKQGFDYSLCYLDQRVAHDYYVPYLWKNEEKLMIPENANGGRNVYSHDLFFSHAVQFIKDNKSKPFFLYLPFTIPHNKYEVPSNAAYANQKWGDNQKNYAAMITKMDGDIGKMMALLKELKLDENTIVFFASDNGPVEQMLKTFGSAGPFRSSKGDLYEGGIRVPLIARWPGKIAPGKVSPHVSMFSDFLPTMSELIGASNPAKVDGISFLPTLLGKSQKAHDFLYWEFFNTKVVPNQKNQVFMTQQAVRMGDWKAVRVDINKNPNAPLELYNLKTDVGEKNNVAAQNPEILKKIQDYIATTRQDGVYFSKK
ncbi:N-acetylgalactosamine-6-sulfatase [Adhaeribacter aerolatus]|uniref:N-acetylgalactosamine-6-sulfatase n=1 Tax=Adhaeribacter aerolatus TaxID=670289 RepID=A0A512B3U9_9BACT|nr:arylsulfatase [Adhaeribacter aerolatus]GEO06467.1 N-acetylgalactosamine-6-sulfatase [Adhaeribacter aerolatus]